MFDSRLNPTIENAAVRATHVRRAKIVCTIGPATDSEAMVRQLLLAGMDVARLNFSHGTYDNHARVIALLRRIAAEEGHTICVLQDLQGPKIRTGKLQGGQRVQLRAGSRVTITPDEIEGTAEKLSTTFKTLAQDVHPGSRVLLSDGLIELRVVRVTGGDVECEVVNGGMLGENQGINLPGTAVSVPAMTEKDRADLKFGIEHGVDAVALSFVRTADDVREIKTAIANAGADTPVIAKLEKPQAIDHLDAILEIADGVMVARGDLGVEVPPEQVPVIQKHIIRRAFTWRKPVITATQMLESMIENPRPTRAEASDVANAVFDGTDAVMLSGETARGKFPREAVEMMSRIVLEAEAHMEHATSHKPSQTATLSVVETICDAVSHAAADLDMRAIAVFTLTGTTARLLSKFRPRCPIYGFADEKICNRLNLYWGLRPFTMSTAKSSEDMLQSAERLLLQRGMVAPGEVLGVITGKFLQSGATSIMLLHTVQEREDRSRGRT